MRPHTPWMTWSIGLILSLSLSYAQFTHHSGLYSSSSFHYHPPTPPHTHAHTHTHTHSTPRSQRWWPCEVIHPSSIPDNILSKKPGEGMFVVRFCGSQDFAWSYHGRTVPYTENYDIVQPHRKQKTTDAAFKKGKYITFVQIINSCLKYLRDR